MTQTFHTCRTFGDVARAGRVERVRTCVRPLGGRALCLRLRTTGRKEFSFLPPTSQFFHTIEHPPLPPPHTRTHRDDRLPRWITNSGERVLSLRPPVTTADTRAHTHRARTRTPHLLVASGGGEPCQPDELPAWLCCRCSAHGEWRALLSN